MIYLDNSATTQLNAEVYEAMIPYLTEEYGNPSSKYYTLAANAYKAVEKAREQVAELIHAKPEEIVFTCGATESNNTIIKGVADYRRFYEDKGNHIITSKVEHHSVLNTCKFLNGDIYSNRDATFTFQSGHKKVDRGYFVSFLDVNEYGQVQPENLSNTIQPETIIASIIWGNNEIGSVNDLGKLMDITKDKGIFFHSDATQVLGKLDINVEKLAIDALSFSAHKLSGPKGVGAMYIRSDTYGIPPMSSLMHGGEQEYGIRGGTLSVAHIAGFGKAAELANNISQKKSHSINNLDKEMDQSIRQYDWIEIIGSPHERIPGIFSIVIHDTVFNNELFMKHISSSVAVSAGSACTAGQPSHVLDAIGRKNQTSKVLRISVNEKTTMKDIQIFLEKLSAYVMG